MLLIDINCDKIAISIGHSNFILSTQSKEELPTMILRLRLKLSLDNLLQMDQALITNNASNSDLAHAEIRM
jgi:hypothetical protein